MKPLTQTQPREADSKAIPPNRMPQKPVKSKQISWLLILILLVIMIMLLIKFPTHRQPTLAGLQDFLLQMITIFPAILILMGLFSAWTSPELVLQYLGKESGIKGVALALLLGALPTGPLYVAFPLTAMLRQKGASPANLVIFLSAWACIKIPQEMVEWQFLGLRFMLTRLALTLVLVVIMGLIVGKVLAFSENKPLVNDH